MIKIKKKKKERKNGRKAKNNLELANCILYNITDS
jgi:hypothetical protein